MLFLVLHLLGDLLEIGSRSVYFAASLFYTRISRVPNGFAASAFLHQLKCRAYVRYYGPLRHPIRPGLSLASCQLIPTAITAGASRVASGLLMRTCRRHYPGRFDEACSLVSLHRLRPSLCNSQVGSCNCFFGACSAFTHVMACTLAESLNDP